MDAEAELVVPITSKTEGLSCGSPLHPCAVELSWGIPWAMGLN